MLYRHIHPEIISVRRLHEFIHLNDPEKIVHPPFSIDRKLFAVGVVYVRSRRRLTGTFHERERNGSRLGKGYNKNWESKSECCKSGRILEVLTIVNEINLYAKQLHMTYKPTLDSRSPAICKFANIIGSEYRQTNMVIFANESVSFKICCWQFLFPNMSKTRLF